MWPDAADNLVAHMEKSLPASGLKKLVISKFIEEITHSAVAISPLLA